jgi:hypothetical protein
MWLAQFVCAPQFFKTPKGLCGHTVYNQHMHVNNYILYINCNPPACFNDFQHPLQCVQGQHDRSVDLNTLHNMVVSVKNLWS